MLKIGITDGIGVGKSVVCKIFAAIAIYDADTRASYHICKFLESLLNYN